MGKPQIDFGKIIGMAVGAVVLGVIPTLILDWFDVWPHFPALLFAILGAAACFFKESPDSEFAEKIQAENRSNALGFLLGAAVLVPFGAWVADDTPDAVAPQVDVEQEPRFDVRDQEATTPEEIVETDIDELLAVYERNQIEGLQRFGNSTLKISGEVVRVREVLGAGVLVMKSPKTGTVMELGFSERGTPQTGALQPGQRVIVTCPGASEAMGEVYINDCSDVAVVG